MRSGTVIVPMDGDLQNDPADIARLLAKLDEGYDVVSGWRVNRAERSLARTVPSKTANWVIGRVTGVRLHDFGCSLKAYRAEVVKETRLYGEMHRFIPVLAYQVGASITEIPVNHRPRVHGRSKYGLKRTFKVLLDLVTLKFLSLLDEADLRLRRGGLILCFLGILAGAETIYQRLVNHVYVYRNPFILIAVLLVLAGREPHPDGPARRAGDPDLPRVAVEADLLDPRGAEHRRLAARRPASRMCGICGIVERERPVSEAVLAAMTETLRHRGPDDRGLWVRQPEGRAAGSGSASAGSRSSTWPAGTSRSPTRTARFASICNGEIYNYRELRATSSRAATSSRRTATARCSSTCGRSAASRCSPSSTGCSRSRSGTTARRRCSSRATASARSRCTTSRRGRGSCSAPSSRLSSRTPTARACSTRRRSSSTSRSTTSRRRAPHSRGSGSCPRATRSSGTTAGRASSAGGSCRSPRGRARAARTSGPTSSWRRSRTRCRGGSSATCRSGRS